MKSLKSLLLLLVMTTFVVIIAACGGGDDAQSGSGELEGSVVVDGSGTVYPLMARLAEDYMINEQEGVSVEVSRAGTSAGFKKFLVEDGTDFNDASRQIKDEEKAKAEELGLEIKEIKSIFLASGNKKMWSDVRPDFPAEEIKTYGPNENHGTYEFFWETILEEQDLVEGVNLQQDYSTLVDLVSKDKNAIGFFGYGYYANNTDKISAVKVDFGNGPVEPSLDTIKEDGDYAPFTRPVFTYLNVNNAKEKPQVLDFARYVMTEAGNVAGETGFAPLPEAELQQALSEIEGLK
jgi:phosphate transport system substrate-binding protein